MHPHTRGTASDRLLITVRVDNDLARLAFEASVRSLDKQERLLDELRARTGLLLAASSLAISFVGRPVFQEADTLVLVLGLLAFAISIAASVYVLLPKPAKFVFSLEGSAVFEQLYEFRDDMSEVYRRLTYDLDRFWEENDDVMTQLFRWFQVAAVALAAEIMLLLASLSGTLF
jgi:hypothetical protein